MERHQLIVGDCLEVMRGMADNSVDLVMTSPPYSDARTYNIGFALKGQAWVDWSVERYLECVRISRGLVAWVVEGRTNKFRWSATPALLMADLHRAGVKLRKPPIYNRIGIPGSGGPDFWRNDYELIVCSTKGKLPWSDNTAMGHVPKYAPGGEMSYRNNDGVRKNARDTEDAKARRRNETRDGFGFSGKSSNGRKTDGTHKRRRVITIPRDGMHGRQENTFYTPPKKANPGNVVRCKVGGGHMGHPIAHENEAPYPESLVLPFIRSFCPPDGIVLDPFGGSGTTAAVAFKEGRRSICIDIRDTEIERTHRRLEDIQK